MNKLSPDALALRDIHLPDSVAWFPPAIGWWLLLLLVVLVMAYYGYRRWFERYRLEHEVNHILLHIEQKFRHEQDKATLLRELSSLLRRVSITLDPKTASLVGQDWLHHLDQKMNGEPFSTGLGRLLATAPYQPIASLEYSPQDLLNLVKTYLNNQAVLCRQIVKP